MAQFITPNEFLETVKKGYEDGKINDEQFQYLHNLYIEHYKPAYEDYEKSDNKEIYESELDMIIGELELIIGPITNTPSK